MELPYALYMSSCMSCHVLVCSRVQNMKIIDGKPEYKGALVSVFITTDIL